MGDKKSLDKYIGGMLLLGFAIGSVGTDSTTRLVFGVIALILAFILILVSMKSVRQIIKRLK